MYNHSHQMFGCRASASLKQLGVKCLAGRYHEDFFIKGKGGLLLQSLSFCCFYSPNRVDKLITMDLM